MITETRSFNHKLAWLVYGKLWHVENQSMSADPASPWPRQGGAWGHRRCGTLLSLNATVNCTTASDLLWASKLTDASLRPSLSLPHAQELLGFSMVSAGTLSGFMGFRRGFMGFQDWRMAACPDLVGAGFSHAAAGALAGFMGFQNWRMAPGPDPKGFPRPKMSLEVALAVLRLAPSLVLWGFKTDGWPLVPISKASPGPKCCWSWL